MENGRVCQRCGAALEKNQIKWCKACAKAVKQERERLNYVKQERKARTLICPWCGKEFVTIHGNRKYCDQCMSVDKKATRCAPVDAVRPLVAVRTTIPEKGILRLVPLYGPPYDSYGKLKAYLENVGKLPPDSCLRSAHPNVVDQQAFRSTPGERWF